MVTSKTNDLENGIRYKVNDCETLVRSRITEDYVKNLGERIRKEIIEDVSGKKLDDSFVFSLKKRTRIR